MSLESRIAGYRWALSSADSIEDDKIFGAYQSAFPGGRVPSEDYAHFEQGAMDTLSLAGWTFATIPDAAIEAGVSARYLNAEIAAGRLVADGSGKNRRISYKEFRRWMSNPRRGSRGRG